MAISVPSEPKIYTTVYDNFKGVDFTNDPTNVYRRRSPDGVNMLPDLDGRPFKRTGWDVEITHNDFINAVEGLLRALDYSYEPIPRTTPITPIKVYYFETNGMAVMCIFNSAGVFTYCKEYGLYCAVTFLTWEDMGGDTHEGASLDLPLDVSPDRCFFFEGNGVARFYVFSGSALYATWFSDEDGIAFEPVQPKVPRVLTQCDPFGVGNTYEEVNLLTRRRTVGYLCDGTTREFIVPGGLSGNIGRGITVKVVDPQTGEWETVPSSHLDTMAIDEGKITFLQQYTPQVVHSGEDNLRVTYIPDGHGGGVDFVTDYSRDIPVEVIRQQVYKMVNSEYVLETTSYQGIGASDYLPGLVAGSITPQVKAGASYIDDIVGSYVSAVPYPGEDRDIDIEPKSTLFTSGYEHRTTEKTTYSTYNGEIERKIVTTTKYFYARLKYSKTVYHSGDDEVDEAMNAFIDASRCMVFGNGIYNQVFVGATSQPNFKSRLWYSAAGDPTYFPDLNYIEVGATDTSIVGMVKVDNYLGVVKEASGLDTSIYLAYPTSFMDLTTYAVKQGVNGVGALSKGAFNILDGEPLFLTKDGIYAVDTTNDGYVVHNRSYFVNKRLCAEPGLKGAYSFIHDGMYLLAVNGHVYALDGSQKNSWANTKTNLQYEAYFLDNVPAHCFAKFEGDLWFSDFSGNMCRAKTAEDDWPYHDAYTMDPDWITSAQPTTHGEMDDYIPITALTAQREQTSVSVGETVQYDSNGVKKGYTVYEVNATYIRVEEGVPITAVWSTIADDDGAVHFFKNLKKKGSMVSLLPSSDSGVQIYLKPDRKDPIFVCESDAKQTDIPFDVYMKKKIKKYKRLQIICKNSTLDDAFGVDQIIKCYTMGNYSKNRG